MVAIQTSANKNKEKKAFITEPKSVVTPRLAFNYTMPFVIYAFIASKRHTYMLY